MAIDPDLGLEDFCYVTTTGRVSGLPREIEIWFALQGDTLYILSGGGDRSDWVKNARRQPSVSVKVGGRAFSGAARIVEDAAEDALARRLVYEKYAPRYGGDLTDWRASALPVAIDLRAEERVPR